MFSGVLDGGRQYHTEGEVIELIRKNFDIRQTAYNHWAIYRKLVESPLDKVRSILRILLQALEMSNDEYRQWVMDGNGKMKFKITKALRSARPVSIWILRTFSKLIKLIVGSRHLALFFHWLSKGMRGSRKADEIVVVAVKK